MRPEKRTIYLDNNATTPLMPEVAAVMKRCISGIFGNPSSSHPPGAAAKAVVENARKHLASLVSASPDEIVFTSGGTEADNIAVLGTARRHGNGHIITSCIEHPAILNPLRYLEQQGFAITRLPVDRHGLLDPEEVVSSLRKDTFLVTIMHSNNETGTIQPIGEIGKLLRDRGIVFHSDAAQSVGKVPVNVKKLGVQMLTIVSHKFYGPKGVGALYIKKGTEVSPIMFGASHEKGLRPGTENVCSIAGLGRAAEAAKKEMPQRVRNMKYLSRLMYRELKKHIPGIGLNGHPSQRLPNTLNISFPGVKGHVLLDGMKDRIAASTGSACHEGTHTPSPVLKAMGMSDDEALSAVRFSLGRDTTERQIRAAVKVIVSTYQSLTR